LTNFIKGESDVYSIALGIIVCALGIVLLTGYGAFLIAGYNTISATEKGRYDESKLCRFVGVIVLAIGIDSLVISFFPKIWLVGVLIIVALAILLLFMQIPAADSKNRANKSG
jgi:hypothetical protein